MSKARTTGRGKARTGKQTKREPKAGGSKESFSSQPQQGNYEAADPERAAGNVDMEAAGFSCGNEAISDPAELAELRRELAKADAKGKPIEYLYFEANQALTNLFESSGEGDGRAMELLRACLSYNVERFLGLCTENLALTRQIVLPGQAWPLLHTDLERRKGYLTIPSKHPLAKLGVVHKHRTFDANGAIGTRIANELFLVMVSYRRRGSQSSGKTIGAKHDPDASGKCRVCKEQVRHIESPEAETFRGLKPLTPNNYPEWWSAAQSFFLRWWGTEFQDDNDFKGWNSSAYKNMLPHVARSHKRRDIKRSIKQGFKAIGNSFRARVLD